MRGGGGVAGCASPAIIPLSTPAFTPTPTHSPAAQVGSLQEDDDPEPLGEQFKLGINNPALLLPKAPAGASAGGGEAAAAERLPEEVVVCFGIIDILQDYSVRKVMERQVGARPCCCTHIQLLWTL